MCGAERAIRGAFGEHGLNLIFQIKCEGWFGGCARRSLGAGRRPLSVHPVKGLSAAAEGVESEGSSRVHAASQECLCLSARRPPGVVQLVRGERGRDGVYAAAPLIQVSHQKSPFSFKLAESAAVLDCCQENTASTATFCCSHWVEKKANIFAHGIDRPKVLL